MMAMLCSSPLGLLFFYLGGPARGIGAWICAGIILIAMRARWDLRNHLWFWMAILTAVILQVPFILFVPWMDSHLSHVSLLPFGILDYAIAYGCIKLAEKAMK